MEDKRYGGTVNGKKLRSPWMAYGWSAVLIAVITFFGEFLKRYIDPANLVMIYLLGVIIVAIRYGRGPAIATSVLSVLVFDFFLIPPYLTFAVEDWQYLVTFAGFLVTGLIASELTLKAREESEKERQLKLLQATEKLHRALLSSISHELRTPLSSIMGSISMLLQDEPSLDEETIHELLRDALQESGRLNRLVGNLLDMTRLEAGAFTIAAKPCELGDVIGVSLQELKDKLNHRTLDIRIPSDFPEINVDFSLMVKVFVNLIENAVKYSPEGSPIRIAAKIQNHQVRIEISDEGIGIPEEDLKRIFGKFYRAANSHAVKGLGLGLSISKGIVEAHGGEIWAERNPGQKGMTFFILLPCPKVSS